MDSRLSNAFSTPRKLALAGIIVNIVLTVIVIMFLIFIFSQLGSLWEWIPEIPEIHDFPTDWFSTFFSNIIIWIVVFLFIFQIIFGVFLPAIGYMKAHPGSKNLAAALFIVSGVLTITFIGGILLIIAGVLVLVEESDDEYIPSKPDVRTRATPKGKSVCPKCNSTLIGDEMFCPFCGAKVS